MNQTRLKPPLPLLKPIHRGEDAVGNVGEGDLPPRFGFTTSLDFAGDVVGEAGYLFGGAAGEAVNE